MNTTHDSVRLAGRKVKVYWNLHKLMFSVMDAQTGRVIAHVHTLRLDGITFKVSEAGRKRVIATGRKNVHAFVCGMVASIGGGNPFHSESHPMTARYNPYRGSSFTTDEGVIHEADHALVVGVNRPTVYVLGAR